MATAPMVTGMEGYAGRAMVYTTTITAMLSTYSPPAHTVMRGSRPGYGGLDLLI